MTMRRLGLILLSFMAIPSVVAAQTETAEYYAADAVRSIRVVFDVNGNVTARLDYGPFGQEIIVIAGAPRERFNGQEKDGENDSYYLSARLYQARVGRFTRPDPVYNGAYEPQRWNRYAYALNNPLVFRDPSGLNAASDAQTCTWISFTDDDGVIHGQLNCGPSQSGGGGGSSSIADIMLWLFTRLSGTVVVGGPESELVPTTGGGWQPSGTAENILTAGLVVASLVGPLKGSIAGRGAAAVIDRTAAEQLAVNAAAGRVFEQQVIDALGAIKNTQAVDVPGLGRSIPDILSTGITEVKNVINLSLDRQLQIEAAASEGPFNLIVSPRTQTISQPLQNAVSSTGGVILVYDPVTGQFHRWP